MSVLFLSLLRYRYWVSNNLCLFRNNRLAKEIGVPAQHIGDIVAGKCAITADTDLRLCRFFGLSRGYWLRAEVAHDTEATEREPIVLCTGSRRGGV
ncbi:HigA family addiction module antidote protein [Alcanivorax marinus]|nr:HigA family addiction module antidote protein [Alloalcanivorax marinus]